MGWSDVGDWEALAELLTPQEGNWISGTVLALDANANIVMDSQGLTALLGVDHLLVVRAGDAILVCRRDRAQDLRRLVARLEDAGFARYL
jgi:mannose-1-phosphate guanylyltransferase